MWNDMADYFRAFVRISDDPGDFVSAGEGLVSSMKEGEGIVKADIVDSRYFQRTGHPGGTVYFWGDDDYEQRLLELADAFEGLDVTLLEGYYFFMQYGGELAKKFKAVEKSESYDEVLKGAGRFITSSPQSALEALAAGSNPVYLEKPGVRSAWRAKMESFGIPVLETFSGNEISRKMAETFIYNDNLLRNDAASEVATYIKDKLS